MEYQQLEGYSGALYGMPRHQGIEYDHEVPDNLIVTSPGGVSTTHHHWTGGFYGQGNESGDIYAGQGERYNHGIHGNLYVTGHEAGHQMGYYSKPPDHTYWKNQYPPQKTYTQSLNPQYDTNLNMSGVPKKNEIENYEGIELIDSGDGNYSPDIDVDNSSGNSSRISPWLLFLFFLIAFVAFDFWAATGHLFVKQTFHKGDEPSWTRSLIYSVIITAIFALVIYFAGVPVTTFEKL